MCRKSIAAFAGLLLMGAVRSASADEVVRLDGKEASIQHLMYDGDAETDLVWRGYRGGGFGRPFAWGASRPFVWGGRAIARPWHRPYWGGGYRPFAYRPWRWGGGYWGGRYYGGGYYGGGYYGGGYPYLGGYYGVGYYSYPGYFSYYGCSDAPALTFSLGLPDAPAYSPGNGNPVMPPANGDGTFPYSDPASPVPMPDGPAAPATKPRPTTPAKGLLVSQPVRKAKANTYLAYGEKGTPPATENRPASTRPSSYTFQAYGESRPDSTVLASQDKR